MDKPWRYGSNVLKFVQIAGDWQSRRERPGDPIESASSSSSSSPASALHSIWLSLQDTCQGIQAAMGEQWRNSRRVRSWQKESGLWCQAKLLCEASFYIYFLRFVLHLFLRKFSRRPLTVVEEEEDLRRALELSLASSTPSTPAPKLTPAPEINTVAVGWRSRCYPNFEMTTNQTSDFLGGGRPPTVSVSVAQCCPASWILSPGWPLHSWCLQVSFS